MYGLGFRDIVVTVLVSTFATFAIAAKASTCRLDWEMSGPDQSYALILSGSVDGRSIGRFGTMVAGLKSIAKSGANCEAIGPANHRVCQVLWNGSEFVIGKGAVVPGGRFESVASLREALSLLHKLNFCQPTTDSVLCEVREDLGEFRVFRGGQGFGGPHLTERHARESIQQLASLKLCASSI